MKRQILHKLQNAHFLQSCAKLIQQHKSKNMFTVVAVREYVLERQMVDDFEQSAGQLNLKKKKKRYK